MFYTYTYVIIFRILDYSQDATEDDWEKTTGQLPPDWPLNGGIVFKNVTVTGQAEIELLSQINLEIIGGEKIGIVGRSGSGKTTLINTLYRIMEPTEGQILIDNIDIRNVGLHQLRRKLSVIPQTPYIFAGTLRLNLDPLKYYPDDEIWSALGEVNLLATIKAMGLGLDTNFTAEGWQISPGQAQLIALARILLEKNQIICLDHAMNNLDPQSQRLIQKKIKEKFAKCTVLTVSHRLQPRKFSKQVKTHNSFEQ
jgi:ABC-type multidrug transport system fused ATPase/permease subunit